MSDEKNPNEEQRNDERSFLKETWKDEQISGKKILQAICKTAGKGLVFGIAACLAFCALKPWVESRFNQDNNKVSIPKDEVEEETAEEETKEEKPTMTAENYREMNKALREVALEARNCIVEISGGSDSSDWKEDSETTSVSGVIIWDNGSEILVLAPYGELPSKGNIQVKFSDNKEYDAQLKRKDKNLGFGIYVVTKNSLQKTTLKSFEVAEWGNSYALSKGDPVIALGMQFGYSDGMGYGVISSMKNYISLADYKYQIITTDIAAVSQGSGVLFNIDGQVIGIVDQKNTDITGVNLVSAYAISEIKAAIELLSNGSSTPYLGVIGVEVTEEISEKEGIPEGIYVKEVEAESPAMEAGIQCGDVIVKMDGTDICSQKGYSNKLMGFSQGEEISIQVMRQGAEEYEKIKLKAKVGAKQ